jgi:serine protease Do
MTKQLRQRYNIADEARGVVVLNVDVKSNAAGKGLKAGDVIVEVDHKAVVTPADVEKRIAAAKANGYKVVTFPNLSPGRLPVGGDQD